MKKITLILLLLVTYVSFSQTISISNIGDIGTSVYQGETITVEVSLTGVDGNFEIGFTGGSDLPSSSVTIDATGTTAELGAFVGAFGDNAGFTNTFINLVARTVNDGMVTLDIVVPSDFTFGGASSIDVQLVTVLNGGSANSADNITVFVDEAASLSTKDFQTFSSFYPNPVKDKIFLKGDLEADSYKVLSVTGALIKEVDGALKSIDVSDLKAGLYFLSTGKAVGKFIKQ